MDPKLTAERILANEPAIDLMDDIRPLAQAYLDLLKEREARNGNR